MSEIRGTSQRPDRLHNPESSHAVPRHYLEKLSIALREAERKGKRSVYIGGVLTGALALALAFSPDSKSVGAQSLSGTATPTSPGEIFRVLFPSLLKNFDLSKLTPPAPVPDKTKPPFIPTLTPPPSPTERPPATETREAQINADPEARVWEGVADPYKPSGSFRTEGVSPAIKPARAGSGWLTDTRATVLRFVDEAGKRFSTLRSAFGAGETLPDASQEVEAEEEMITRPIVDASFFASDYADELRGRPLHSTGDGAAVSALSAEGVGEFGPGSDEVAPGWADYVAQWHEARMMQADALKQSTGELEPIPAKPDMGSYSGLGPGPGAAFEVPSDSGFKIPFELSWLEDGRSIPTLLILGSWTPESGKIAPQQLGISMLGETVYISDSNPDARGKNFRHFRVPGMRIAPGTLTGSVELGSGRETVTITLVDAEAETHVFAHPLAAPMVGSSFEINNMVPNTRLGDTSLHRRISYEIPASPARGAALQDSDPDARRVADITSEDSNLGLLLDHTAVGIPARIGDYGITSGWLSRFPDSGDIVRKGNRAVYRPGAVEFAVSWGATPEEVDGLRSHDYWQLQSGVSPYQHGAIRTHVRGMQTGDPSFRALVMTDLRSSTLRPPSDSLDPDKLQDALKTLYQGYDAGLFIDAPQIVGPTGALSELVIQNLPHSYLGGARSPEDRAQALAQFTMSLLQPGAEYTGTWVLDPSMPLGVNQTDLLLRQLASVNTVRGYSVREVIVTGGSESGIEGLKARLNTAGYRVGIFEADSMMSFRRAADITRDQLGVDGLITLHDPALPNRSMPGSNVLIGQTPEGLAQLLDDFTELRDGF